MTRGDETLGSDLLEDFWRWAVAQYEDVQVREGLLELQESSGLIILEAMFLAWLGHRGQAIGEEDQRRIRAASHRGWKVLCCRFVGNGRAWTICHL